MPPADVCAVVYGCPPGTGADAVLDAVARQRVSPACLRFDPALTAPGRSPLPDADAKAFPVGGGETSFAAAIRAAGAAGTRWAWLLDGRAVPEAGALDALLAAAGAVPEPEPILLSSKVVDAEGRLHPDAMPRHEVFEKTRSVSAAERHMIQLRTAAHGSLLVRVAALAGQAPPRSDLPAGLDMHEWTARLLQRWEDTGYLVPASVAVRTAPAPAVTPRVWVDRARVIASSGWTPTEKLWEAFKLGGALAATVRGGADRTRGGAGPGDAAGQGRDGVGAPGLSPSRSPRRMTAITRGANRLSRR